MLWKCWELVKLDRNYVISSSVIDWELNLQRAVEIIFEQKSWMLWVLQSACWNQVSDCPFISLAPSRRHWCHVQSMVSLPASVTDALPPHSPAPQLWHEQRGMHPDAFNWPVVLVKSGFTLSLLTVAWPQNAIFNLSHKKQHKDLSQGTFLHCLSSWSLCVNHCQGLPVPLW